MINVAGYARVLVWKHPRPALCSQDQEESDRHPGDCGQDGDLDQDEDVDGDCKRTFYRRRIVALAMSEHVATPPAEDAFETLGQLWNPQGHKQTLRGQQETLRNTLEELLKPVNYTGVIKCSRDPNRSFVPPCFG